MVMTELNFVSAGPDGEVRFVLDNGWSGTGQRAVPIGIRDLRGRPLPDLDHDGFTLDRLDNRDIDFDDIADIAARWFPAVKELVLAHTGASFATLFAGPLRRFSNRHERSTGSSVSAPARAVHADLHEAFAFHDVVRQPVAERAAAEVQAVFGAEAPERWRVVNLWQMLSHPPQDNTLALCRRPSVRREDVIAGKGLFDQPGAPPEAILAARGGQHDFDITFFAHHPAQDWCWFSGMQPGEMLLFSTFDPADAVLRGRVPHAAFDLAWEPGVTVPRRSIEIRALLAW